MDAMTVFVGIIAFCMLFLTIVATVVLVSILKAVKSLDEKTSLIVYEISAILPNIRKTTQNIAELSGIFNVLSFFKKSK